MQSIIVDTLPPALGPYCHACRTGNLLFVSGQVPVHPQTGDVVGENMTEQTHQTMQNLAAVLKHCGLGFEHIVKTTVFINDMNAFADMNAVYAEYMGDHKPARACVEISRIAKDMKVEIEAIAEFPA